MDASAGDGVAAAARGDAASDLDAEVVERSLQDATPIERVRSEVEGKPVSLARGGAAARRRGLLDDDDRDAAVAQEGSAEEASQAPADDDDWGFVIGHTSITIASGDTVTRLRSPAAASYGVASSTIPNASTAGMGSSNTSPLA